MESAINRQDPGRLLLANVWLGLIVALLFALNFYTKTITLGPFGIHQWRQSDCMSIAKNYYEDGMHFFSPKIHFQGPKDGRAVSEMPVLNYTAAALWKVFGEEPYLYRLLEYLIFLTAVFTLFNTIGVYLRSWLLAMFSASLLLTSPLLTYYSLNFIADVPALSIGIISFCLFYRFYIHLRLLNFYLALLLGTLAILMKASAVIPLALLYFFSLASITSLHRFVGTKELFERRLFPLLGIVLSALVVVSWYRWALAYNYNKSENIFLLTILPIWEMQEEEIIRNLKILSGDLFPVFLNRPMLFLFFTLVFYVMSRFRQLSIFFRYTFVVTGIYFVAYLLFFYKVFSVHDYYLNNLMIFPVVTLMAFAELNLQNNFVILNTRFVRIFLVVTLVFNGFYAAAFYRMRMIEDDVLCQWFPFISEEDRKIAKYYFWDYSRDLGRVEKIKPVLRQHGIRREDLVISIPDQSFNISLYMMDQKGYTVARNHFEYDSLVTDHFRHKHVQYLVLSDTTLKLQPAFRHISPYLQSYFRHGGIEVFKVKPEF